MSSRPPHSEQELLLAVHAGILALDAIDDAPLRERIRSMHDELLQCADPDAEGEGHLPAWILATWPRLSEELAPLEREAIELHLASCASCGEELSVLAGIRQDTPTSIARPRRARGNSLTAIWAAIATAAAVLLWLRGLPGPPAGELEVRTFVVPAAVRTQTEPSELRLAPGSTQLRVDLSRVFPPPRLRELQAGAVDHILLVGSGPSAAVSLTTEAQTVDAFSREPSFLLRTAPGESLVDGRYDIQIWLLEGKSGHTDDGFTLRLVIAPSD